MNNSRGFIFEHPMTARSWMEPLVQDLLARPGVFTVDFAQCRYGLRSPAGNTLKKPTKLMSNMPSVLAEFSNKVCTCEGGHRGRIEGSELGVRVSTHAQAYPPLMVDALARCCAAHVLGGT